jgi:hypothetical protein
LIDDAVRLRVSADQPIATAMTAPETPEHEFPDGGILWRGWNEETLRLVGQR